MNGQMNRCGGPTARKHNAFTYTVMWWRHSKQEFMRQQVTLL